MAKQKRKAVQKVPITANPLFPAVVALWFGALFGLGSLAVRPSLIEDLVLSSRIDLVIPAAAPPLGMTARIMLALMLAVVGAVIGVILARRLTRPKQEVRERSRNVGTQKAATTSNRARDAHPDAPSCQPISMRDLDPDAGHGPAENAIAGRRRGLTADQTEDQFVPHDFAPLPGGGEPQVLDLAKAGPPMVAPLAPAVVQSEYAPLPPAAPAQGEPARQVFAAEPAPAQAPAAYEMPVAAAPVQAPIPAPTAPQVPVMPSLAPETVAAHADGRQVFGMQPPEPQPEKPRQIFGQAVDGDHIGQDFVREAGYRTTVFEQETPAPLFNREEAAAAAAQNLAPSAPAAMMPEPAPAVAAPVPQAFVPPPAAPAPEPLDLAAAMAAPAPAAASVPAAAAVPPVEAAAPLPSPAGLEMTDLATRLAESMRRRRAARSGEAAAPAVPEAALAAPAAMSAEAPQAAAFTAPPPAAPVFQAPVPEAFNPAAVAPVAAPMPQAFAPEPEAVAPAPAIPAAYAPPVEAPAVPAAYAPPVEAQPMPAAYVPPIEAPAMPAAFAPPAEMPAAPAPAPVAAAPAAPQLPNALRPLALDAFLEDDSQFDSSLLPPRHIAMAAPAAAPVPEPFEPAAENVPGEEAVAEENYASLLGIGQARAGFVRIEEPEPDLSAPEPVVIFPGQAPLAQAAAGAAPAPFAAPDGAAFRRFDSPASMGSGQPVDMGSAPPSVPATEAEQALRSALASLQRISGAA